MQCVVPPRLFLLKTREEPDVGRVHPGMALGVPWCFLVTFLGPSSAGALRFGGGCGLSSPSATSVSFSEWVMHVKLGGHVVSPNPHGSPPGAAPSQALGEPREASNEGRLGASSTAMCTFIPAAPAPPGHPRAAGDGHSAAVQKQWGRRGVGAVPRSVPMDGVRLYTRLDGMAQNKTNLYIYISIYTNI